MLKNKFKYRERQILCIRLKLVNFTGARETTSSPSSSSNLAPTDSIQGHNRLAIAAHQ
jgi:hypothetical protein